MFFQQFVQEKLSENNFDLPEEVRGLNPSNYLKEGYNNYGAMKKSGSNLRAEQVEEKVVEFEDGNPSMAKKPSAREIRQPSAKQLDVETNDVQPKLYRLPSKRNMGGNTSMVPSIRGDRVRGSNRRVLSEKVSSIQSSDTSIHSIDRTFLF